VFNFNRLAGKDGIIGVKTGNTNAAGSCWVFAADRVVANQHVTVLGVVLGEPGPSAPQPALDAGKALLDAAGAALTSVTVVPAGQPAARVTAAWVSGAVPGVDRGTGQLPRVARDAGAGAIPASTRELLVPVGTMVGNLTVRANGQVHQVPVQATSALPGPSLQWRIRHV